MTGPARATVRIDRIVVETDHRVDGFALQRALADAVRGVLAARGLPSAWRADGQVPSLALGEIGWDGRGGEAALARLVAERLHDAADGAADGGVVGGTVGGVETP